MKTKMTEFDNFVFIDVLYVCNHSNGCQTTNNSLVGLVQLTLLCSNQVLCAHRVLTPM